MNVNLKVILALIYVSCLGALLIFLFSYLDFKDLTDYNYIKTNSEVLLSYKEDNLFFFILFFFLFTIVWVFLLGFGSPIAILSGFIFGQLYGTLITLIGLTIGSTLLYTFARYYFRNLILHYLEEKIKNYKNLFQKDELFYFMIFRFAGGGGIPFPIQNVLPVVFDMKIKNYFYSTLLGSVPSIFIINTLGSGVEKFIEQNEDLNYLSIISDPGIYWPIFGFFIILIISFFIKKRFFRK